MFMFLVQNTTFRKKVVVEGSSLRPERGSRVQIRLTESLQEDTQIVKGKGGVQKNYFLADMSIMGLTK